MIVPILVLLVLLLAFGLGGIAVHWLWFVIIAVVLLWLLGWVAPRGGYWRRP